MRPGQQKWGGEGRRRGAKQGLQEKRGENKRHLSRRGKGAGRPEDREGRNPRVGGIKEGEKQGEGPRRRGGEEEQVMQPGAAVTALEVRRVRSVEEVLFPKEP